MLWHFYKSYMNCHQLTSSELIINLNEGQRSPWGFKIAVLFKAENVHIRARNSKIVKSAIKRDS